MNQYDVIIIGAGAAGLFAANIALARGKRVAILEMGDTPARKVMASGGGRCNITNDAVSHSRYFGTNPDFVRGALSRVTPGDIINWAHEHNIQLVEKTSGRYFCADGADAVVNALMNDTNGADFINNTCVKSVTKSGEIFNVVTNNKTYTAKSVIVATGGISFPTLGVSDIGYKIAKSFGHRIVPVRPALCAMATPIFPTEFAGISLDAEISVGKCRVRDSLLFTHFGIGGPAAYRASLYDITDGIVINLLPDINLYKIFDDYKRTNGRRTMQGILCEYLPRKIVKWIVDDDMRNIADIKKLDIEKIITAIQKIHIPANQIKLHGMQSAEVVRGGIDTDEISSKTMESKLCSGLFFVGEVLDIAGDLGGFNLHWAWASGYVAGQNA